MNAVRGSRENAQERMGVFKEHMSLGFAIVNSLSEE